MLTEKNRSEFEIQLAHNNSMIEMAINDSVVRVRFAEKENKDLRKTIIDILTDSYNGRVIS